MSSVELYFYFSFHVFRLRFGYFYLSKRLKFTAIFSSFTKTANLMQHRTAEPPGCQARNQDFMWGVANEAKADPTTEMYFLSSDPFI